MDASPCTGNTGSVRDASGYDNCDSVSDDGNDRTCFCANGKSDCGYYQSYVAAATWYRSFFMWSSVSSYRGIWYASYVWRTGDRHAGRDRKKYVDTGIFLSEFCHVYGMSCCIFQNQKQKSKSSGTSCQYISSTGDYRACYFWNQFKIYPATDMWNDWSSFWRSHGKYAWSIWIFLWSDRTAGHADHTGLYEAVYTDADSCRRHFFHPYRNILEGTG